ncbi:hypothetical protein [Mycoplasma sp. Ms02]|uniref:hypothetical protein n=1 Tax=Mycoplasma sp. Ms02 TaxID=353851 RepID=UPI001C8A962F|nr:hypothetical protein [Mycoplasma sp. Ms02]QZE12413.1 hypothetical protein K4L35_00255 [Mycoplasma sp. Ms02]
MKKVKIILGTTLPIISFSALLSANLDNGNTFNKTAENTYQVDGQTVSNVEIVDRSHKIFGELQHYKTSWNLSKDKVWDFETNKAVKVELLEGDLSHERQKWRVTINKSFDYEQHSEYWTSVDGALLASSIWISEDLKFVEGSDIKLKSEFRDGFAINTEPYVIYDENQNQHNAYMSKALSDPLYSERFLKLDNSHLVRYTETVPFKNEFEDPEYTNKSYEEREVVSANKYKKFYFRFGEYRDHIINPENKNTNTDKYNRGSRSNYKIDRQQYEPGMPILTVENFQIQQTPQLFETIKEKENEGKSSAALLTQLNYGYNLNPYFDSNNVNYNPSLEKRFLKNGGGFITFGARQEFQNSLPDSNNWTKLIVEFETEKNTNAIDTAHKYTTNKETNIEFYKSEALTAGESFVGAAVTVDYSRYVDGYRYPGYKGYLVSNFNDIYYAERQVSAKQSNPGMSNEDLNRNELYEDTFNILIREKVDTSKEHKTVNSLPTSNYKLSIDGDDTNFIEIDGYQEDKILSNEKHQYVNKLYKVTKPAKFINKALGTHVKVVSDDNQLTWRTIDQPSPINISHAWKANSDQNNKDWTVEYGDKYYYDPASKTFLFDISYTKQPQSIQPQLDALSIKKAAYNGSDAILLSNSTLTDQNYVLTFTSNFEGNNTEYTTVWDPSGYLKIEELNAKITNLTTAMTQNPDQRDRNGETTISFDIVGIEETTASKNFPQVPLAGFKKEEKRLDEAGTELNITTKTVPNASNRSASNQVTNEELINLINPNYSVKQATVLNATSSYNTTNGTITLSYNLNSTRNGLNDIQSTQTFTTTFTGFATSETEKARLNQFTATVDYLESEKKALLPKGGDFTDIPSVSDKTKLIFTITKDGITYTSTYDSNANNHQGAYVFNDSANNNPNVEIKVNDISWDPVTEENDISGVMPVSFELSSTIEGAFAERSFDSNEISGFKREQERIQELLNKTDLSTKDFSQELKNKKRSDSITKEEIVELLNPLFENAKAKVVIDDSLEPNVNEGSLLAKIKLESTRDELEGTKTQTTKNANFSGFLNDASDDSYNDFQDQDFIATWIVSNTKDLINPIQASSQAAQTFSNYSVQLSQPKDIYSITNVSVVGYDDISGKTLLQFDVTKTVNGTSTVSKKYYKTVDNFFTEQERVNILKDKMTFDENRNDLTTVDYYNESVQKSEVKASSLEDQQIKNTVISNPDNKVLYDLNSPTISEQDDVLGKVKVSASIITSKSSDELYKVNSSVPQRDMQKVNELFTRPSDEEFAVKANKEIVISGFKTKLQEAVQMINDKEFLNANEKLELINNAQLVVGLYGKPTEFNKENHDRAIKDIESYVSKSKEWNQTKKEAHDQISEMLHLNDSQKDFAKQQIKDSYKDPDYMTSFTVSEEDSTESKVQKATTLNEDMSALKQRVYKTNEESDYNKAKNGIIEQYSSDIMAAKAKDEEQRSDREKALVKLGEDIDKYNKLVDLSNDLINNIDPSTQDLDRTQKDANKVTLLGEVLEGVDLPENANWPSEAVNKLKDAIDANLKQVYKDAIDAFENLNEKEKTALKSQIDQINNSVDENQESKNLVEEANKVLDRAKEIEKMKQNAINKILDAKYLSKEPVEDKDDVQDFVDKIKELDFSDPEQDEANKTKAVEIVKDAKKADLDQGIQNYIDNRLNDENPNKVPESNPDHTQSAQKQSAKQNVSELEGELPRQDDSQEVNSDLQEQKDAIEALKVINNLKEKYNSYINTDVRNESDYLTKRQKLLEEIKKTEQLIETLNNKTFNDPKLEANKKAILDELKQEVIRAKTEVDLVDNVLNIKKPSFTKENFENAFKTDKNALNEQGIDKNNEVIDYIGTDMSMFYDLAKKKVNLSEVNASDLERVNVIKAAKYYQSPVLKSAIESLLPDKASKPYKDIEQLFRDVWALEFLSKEEKYAINLDLLEFKNYHDSDKYKAKAVLLDAAKGDIYRQIDEMQDLNPSQKQGFKLAIIDTNLLKMDPLTKDVEVYESIIEEAKKLDDKMSELVKAAKQAQGLQGSYALDRINELVNSKEVDLLNNNVDAKEMDALIEELKEDIKKALQTVPNISQNFIDKLMEEYKNGASLAQVDKKAIQTSQNRQKVNQLVQDYLNNQNQEIRSEIDEITNQDPESYVDVTNLFAALDAKLEIEKALDKFTSANIEQEDYDSIKQDLKVAYANNYLDSDYAKPIKDQIDALRAKVRDILEKEEAGDQEIKPKDSNESGKPEEKLYIWWWIAGAIVTLGVAGLFAWRFKKRK